MFFRTVILSGRLDDSWQDPDGIVTRRRFVSRAEMTGLRFKPDSLADIAWGTGALGYDPLERLVR